MSKYNKENPLRVTTLFSGYDSQCLALERLKQSIPHFDYELVNWCDCGTVFDVVATSVKRGHAKSCGCYRIENNKNRYKL